MTEQISDGGARDFITFREFVAFQKEQAAQFKEALREHEQRMIDVITNNQKAFGHEVERIAMQRREQDLRKIETLEREVESLRAQLPEEKPKEGSGAFGMNTLLMGRKSGLGWMISGIAVAVAMYALIAQPSLRHLPLIGGFFTR